MKVKRNVILTDPERFIKDPEGCTFILSSCDFDNDADWMKCAEVEFEVGLSSGKIIEAAKTIIDVELGKHTAAINVLENRKNELLAITHDGAK
jgi:hypothetical protein